MRISEALVVIAVLAGGNAFAAPPVDVALKPEGPYKSYPTRTLDDLPSLAKAAPDANLDRFGGKAARPQAKTGFFHAAKVGARWWLIDPEGGLYLDKSVVSVAPMA